MHYTVRTPKVFLLSVWPLPRSLATTGGISVDFSSSPYLDVSVQAVPLIRLWIQRMMTRLYSCRIAPFGYPRIYRSLTAPRGFSQLVTSFIGSRCQGIPLVLFVAWPFLNHQRIELLINSELYSASLRWLIVLRFCAARFLTESFAVSEPLYPTSDDLIMRYLWFFVLVWK